MGIQRSACELSSVPLHYTYGLPRRLFFESNVTTDASIAASDYVDPLQQRLTPLREWLLEAQGSSKAVAACALSQALSEIIVAVTIAISVAGKSFRPMLSMMLFFSVRLATRALGAASVVAPISSAQWPLPREGEWLPTIFGIRSPASHVFLSAGVGVSAIAALELLSVVVYSNYGITSKAAKIVAGALAIALVGYEVALVLAMRASWSCEIMMVLLVARYCGIVADRYSPWVDAFMP
eukprot:gnl/TRDRNA2_/TRDRNA2_173506_c2_seq1.p1 gnl/TRDRNA2_/TRDRNA2_173506_c2~~gnl/TRDRNA2_/TRDRNA2_173506_c2_seq1.p1  ORF type:complete len:238 (+),score=24.66 gnl/TRDRNA2_/TRDRNA2_173506_c2_seq1:51-764(+)